MLPVPSRMQQHQQQPPPPMSGDFYGTPSPPQHNTGINLQQQSGAGMPMPRSSAGAMMQSSAGMPMMQSGAMMSQPNPVAYVGGGGGNTYMQALREHSSLQDSSSSGGGGGSTESKSFVNLEKKILELDEVLAAKCDVAALKRDRDQARAMTVLENRANLDTLYMREGIFSQPAHKSALVETLINMYCQEYEELIERRPGIYIWLQFVVPAVVYNGLGAIQDYTDGQSVHKLRPQPNSTRRAYGATGTPALKRKRDGSIDGDVTAANHPFLLTKFFKHNEPLFNIGTYMERIGCTDFALMGARVSTKHCGRHSANTDQTPKYNGVGITFGKHTVVAINARHHTKGVALTGLMLEDACSVLAEVAHSSPDEHGFNICNQQRVGLKAIPAGKLPAQSTLATLSKEDLRTYPLYGIILQCNGVPTNQGTLDMRAYTNAYYVVMADESRIEDFEAAIERDPCEKKRRIEMGYPLYKSTAALAAEASTATADA